MSHKAQTLAIHCIDFRFQKMINEDLEKRNLIGKVDRVSWAGTSKDIEKIKEACELSLKLHDPDEILIYEHEDCGAYGEDNDFTTHKKNAQKLSKSLKSIKSSLDIKILIATSEGVKEL